MCSYRPGSRLGRRGGRRKGALKLDAAVENHAVMLRSLSQRASKVDCSMHAGPTCIVGQQPLGPPTLGQLVEHMQHARAQAAVFDFDQARH